MDERGVVAELALERGGSIPPHSNPNLTYVLVIEGGGFVRVGDETARVATGDAVVWPPDVIHAAWTEATPMRAIAVEFPGAPADRARLLGPGGEPIELDPDDARSARGAPDMPASAVDDGEPW